MKFLLKRLQIIFLEKIKVLKYILWFPAVLRQSVPDVDILAGRRVTEGHEPRQVRKEAAISDIICVVDRSRSCNSLGLSPVSRVSSFCMPELGQAGIKTIFLYIKLL